MVANDLQIPAAEPKGAVRIGGVCACGVVRDGGVVAVAEAGAFAEGAGETLTVVAGGEGAGAGLEAQCTANPQTASALSIVIR